MERESSGGMEQAEQSPTPLAPTRSKGGLRASSRRERAWDMLWSRTAREAAGYAGAGLLANLFAVVATALLTRNLVPDEFGNYAFAASLLFFVALLFEFGLFVPAARLAAITNGRERRDVVGATLVLYLPVGIAFSATVFALSFFVDGWFHVDVDDALRIAAPVAIAFPFAFVLQQLAQGVDRLHIASTATALAQLFFVLLLLLCLGVLGDLSSTSALALRSLALLVASVSAVVWLRPLVDALARWTHELVRQAREWGLQVYVSRVLSTGTYNMDVLMLGIWANSESVGFYVLAGSLAAASGLPVLGMSSALFVRMARESRIARRWLEAAIAVGAVFTVMAWLLAEPAIRVVFSPGYVAAASLVLPLALGQFVRGIATVYNTFLSAHGRGPELRNAGLVLASSNIAFNFALIPQFGAQGAAWASLLALVANLIAYVVLYRRSYVR